jgi:hypothetical protein
MCFILLSPSFIPRILKTAKGDRSIIFIFGIPYLLLQSTREKIEHERKIKFNIQSTYSSKKDFLSSLDDGSRTVVGLIYISLLYIYQSFLEIGKRFRWLLYGNT